MTVATAKKLREERMGIWQQMTELLNKAEGEGRDFSGEEQEKYDALEKDLDEKGRRAERLEAQEQRSREFERVERGELPGVPRGEEDPELEEQREKAGPVGTKEYEKAFRHWLVGGMRGLESGEHSVLQRGWQQLEGQEQRAAGVGTNSAGGFTVPPAFRNRIVERLQQITAVRDVAMIINTDTGANLPWPTVDDTANVGAILAENTQVTEQDVVFGTAQLAAYVYTSKLIRVSFQLLNDTGFDLEGFLARILATRIGRIQNQHFTTGTGTGQPLGLVTGGTAVVAATGNATGFTYDALVDFTDTLDPAYLGGGGLTWMFSQATRRGLRKIKDSQNRPLWEPSLQVGAPDTFLGYPIKLNNDMPAPAANAKSLAFGDFEEGYVVRDVNDFFLLRLDERYADFLQTGFVGFQRSDGTVQNANAYLVGQNSAT